MTDALARKLADDLEPVLPQTAAGTATGALVSGVETATIQLSEPGYYAVYGTVFPTDWPENDNNVPVVVASVALTTTDPNAEIKPKASVPELNKEIKKVIQKIGTKDLSKLLQEVTTIQIIDQLIKICIG